MGGLIIFLPLILIMYFLMIRPQQRRAKEQQQLLANLDVGDDVILAAGIYGRVSDLDGDTIFLQITDTVEIKVSKDSVAGIVTYGEEEEEDEDEEELVDDE